MEHHPMSLVITGAAGHLGRRTAERLLDRVDPAEVVLVTRRPAELGDLAARGADVRAGDFDDPASLDAAFAGGERLLLISTDALGRRVTQHRTAIDAAVRAGVRHIAYTSLPNPAPGNPAPVAGEHRATEEAVQSSGLAWTLLRNALYSEYRVPEAQAALAGGAFHHNLGEGRTAYVSREDCAAVAAAVLAGGAEHEHKAYDVTGPALLGAGDLARIYGHAGGAPLAAVAIDDAAFVAGAVGAGVPEDVAQLLAGFGRAIREGHLDQRSDVVQRLTGRPAISVGDVVTSALAQA
jgi:NAD(P)H dehydrogenase (quinone)